MKTVRWYVISINEEYSEIVCWPRRIVYSARGVIVVLSEENQYFYYFTEVSNLSNRWSHRPIAADIIITRGR